MIRTRYGAPRGRATLDMENDAIRVLTVDPQGSLVPRIAAVLAEAEDGERLRLCPVSSPSDAVSTAASAAATGAGASGGGDVVLLPLPLAGAEGVLPVIELRSAAPDLPVVVVCGPEHEGLAVKAVQLGAGDYLLANRLYGTLVVRCLRHAVELARVRVQLARRKAEWPPSLRPDQAAEVRAASLRRALPQVFDDLVREYRDLLDQAVDQLTHRVEHGVDARVRLLARRTGELRASPRDVVEIHATAMKALEDEEGPLRLRLYVAEGRVRLLELMGHLATFYRDLTFLRPTGRS